jgi:hypothetical protein
MEHQQEYESMMNIINARQKILSTVGNIQQLMKSKQIDENLEILEKNVDHNDDLTIFTSWSIVSDYVDLLNIYQHK